MGDGLSSDSLGYQKQLQYLHLLYVFKEEFIIRIL